MVLYTFLFLNITGISIPFKLFGKLNLPNSPPTLLSQGKNKKTTQIFQRILNLKKQVLMLNCNRKCWKSLIIPTYYVETIETVNTCQHYRALTGITKTIYEIYMNITTILWMRKLRIRKVKIFTQIAMASNWQVVDFNSLSLIPMKKFFF